MHDLVVIGGGAAGFFASLAAKEANPQKSVLLLEKTKVLLSKVRISGGGRCNVTHFCFDPLLLAKHYPRGSKELIGPFHRFGPKQIIEWFESKNVLLKTEKDNRVFPITDNSETIINCLLEEAKTSNVEILLRQPILSILKREEGFEICMKDQPSVFCQKLILATGSSQEGHSFAQALGHKIEPPVPSLFTFNIPNSPLSELSGVSLENVHLSIKGTSLEEKGILLITHFGFSGPAVLRLSAWGARIFHEHDYKLPLVINWIYPEKEETAYEKLVHLKNQSPQKQLSSENLFNLPKNLWKALLDKESLSSLKLADISHKSLRRLANMLHKDTYQIDGKTTHKEEFVTCGGVNLKEVDFKTMESKVCPNLYFAGEVLDIDGITGGFNFQNAWTTGYIAGTSAVH